MDNIEKKEGSSSATSQTSSTPAENTDEKKPSIPIYRLFRYADTRDTILICLAILCSTAVGALAPASIIIFGKFLDRITTVIAQPPTSGDVPDYIAATVPVILVLVYMATAVLVASYGAQTLWIMSGENQTRRIRVKYLHAILRQDMTWFDKSKDGSLTTRLISDTQLIQDGISEKFGLLVVSIAQFISGMVVGFTGDWLLSLVILATFPILGIAATVMGLLVTKYTAKAQDAYADAGKIAEESFSFSGIRTIYAFSMENRFAQRYFKELEHARVAGARRTWVFGMGSASFLFVFFSTYALSFWYGSTLVNQGRITGANVVIAFFGIILGAVGLMTLPQNLASITSACGAAHNIYATIERVPTIDSDDIQGRTLPDSWTGDIEFQDISFSYPTRNNVPVLTHFNLSIKSGSTLALVGSSGSGKSTIIQLLQRFYDPNEGDIKVSQQSIKSLDVSWLRKNMGVVSQEPVLFNMSVKQNVLLGASDPTTITTADIEHSCKMANCHDFISQLPQGYDTIIGPELLSGGQKQRVAIARAILDDPKILILDEATSALDTQSERIVQHALDAATENRTTIIIAHRLSTIRNADLIVVMEKGEILEQGSHDELLAFGNVYSDLIAKQTIALEQTRVTSGNTGTDPAAVAAASIQQPTTETTPVEELLRQEKVAIEMDMDDASKTMKGQAVTLQEPHQQATLDDGYDQKLQRELEDKALRKEQKAPISRVISQMKTEWLLLSLGCVGAILSGMIFPAFGYVFSQVVVLISTKGGLVSNGPMNGANLYSFLLMIVGLGSFVGFGIKIVCFELAGEAYTKRLRHQVFQAYLRQEVGYYDASENSTGALTTKLAVDAKNVNEMVTKVWGEIIQTILTAVSGLIIAFVFSWQLTLVILGIAPLLIAGALYETKVEQGLGDSTKKANEDCGDCASEAIKEVRTVVSLNKQDYFEQRFFKATERPHKMTTKKAWMASFGYACTQGVPLYAQSIAFYAGMRFISNGWIDYNQMFSSMMMVLITSMGVGSGLVFTKSFTKGKLSAIAVFEVIDRAPKIDPQLEGIEPSSDTIQGSIAFEDVKFAYPTRKNHPIFNGHLNFKVDAMKKVALVGSSGCGKSTTIGLLERWYDVDSGNIRLDGHDTKSFTLGNLRSHMALVGQEPALFDLSILENIRCGNKRDLTMEEIEEACKMANILDFIKSLPDGFETRVGDKGSQISGGQKQRIAIARALVRKPNVLLLDEATSALDSESEKLVQEALDKVLEQGGRTTITIAHRLSTIQNSDLICVIDDGRVVESGTHWELLKIDGLYAQLVRDQSLKTI
ncbi:P-loop containing nucleoside triphosphate hydrolase protein [Absidia repens]|uniref:p-loop containing nucleoside triphosphate hydrolase protein n=1 Tax=Absidia repens TaxID=90262 RepID=A0A1X2ICI1_9FUNG|nr:P-loop containing nucleoside triphosphate hydrolase protein [Absidia repens]